MTVKEFLHYKNIWKSPITSVLGFILLLMVGRKYWINHTLDANDMLLLGIAKGLLLAKDPNQVNIPPGSNPSVPQAPYAGMMVGLIVMVLFSSCVTARKCYDKFGRDSVQVIVRDTVPVVVEVPVPGDSLQGKISRDSLDLLLNGVIDSLTDVSNSDRLTIKFWRDHYTNALRYAAEVKPDTVKITKEVPVELPCDCPPIVVVEPEQVARWYVIAWKRFQVFSGYLVLAEVLLVLCIVLWKWLKRLESK